MQPPSPGRGSGGRGRGGRGGGRGGRGSGPSPRKSGTNVKPPVVVFKGYNPTQNSPPETAYAFGGVPPCKGDLQDSVLLRPSTRAQWFVCLQELESLAQESLDRRATRLEMTTPSGLPLVYIADRMDIDDPLWGYQVRSSKTGWLQGFVTLTVFDLDALLRVELDPPRLGDARRAPRKLAHRPRGPGAHRLRRRRDGARPTLGDAAPAAAPAAATCTSALLLPDLRAGLLRGAQVTQLAGRVGVRAADIVAWNVHRFSNITVNSRVQPGTVLFVQNPAVCDLVAVQGREETPQKLARRVGIDTQDLLQLNAVSHRRSRRRRS